MKGQGEQFKTVGRNDGRWDHLPWEVMGHSQRPSDQGPEDAEARIMNEKTWVWCLHCERAYQLEEAWYVDGLWRCAYWPDCDGDAVMDAREWESIQEQIPDRFPLAPVRGEVYVMYPTSGKGKAGIVHLGQKEGDGK